MEFLQPLADLLGVTLGQLTTVIWIAAALLVGWAVLKVVLKLAIKVFSTGCLTIVIIAVGLYLYFAFLAR
jgi:hypothetical protein